VTVALMNGIPGMIKYRVYVLNAKAINGILRKRKIE
jgi:hypothetical protein